MLTINGNYKTIKFYENSERTNIAQLVGRVINSASFCISAIATNGEIPVFTSFDVSPGFVRKLYLLHLKRYNTKKQLDHIITKAHRSKAIPITATSTVPASYMQNIYSVINIVCCTCLFVVGQKPASKLLNH